MARVLVVDDEPDLRFLLRRLFEAQGYEVDEAVDGVAALERCRENAPDLVVTDGDMPRMDGGELIRQLREHGPTPLPVILWSVNPGKFEGADRSFAKPYGGSEIVVTAEELLAGEV
ncbi:MAG: response regulator [Nitriliruptorales bacterium]|nr:response regulator [Nitriliruptorales bacterium]